MASDIQLSKNFRLSEFTISPTADRNGISNKPGDDQIKNLRRLCELILQPARDALGPLRILSGYRSAKLNKLVGGAANSGHRLGHAADLVPMTSSTRLLAEWVVDNCPRFDQVILEFGTLDNPNWIHLSSDPQFRQQVLRASKKGGATVYQSIKISNRSNLKEPIPPTISKNLRG